MNNLQVASSLCRCWVSSQIELDKMAVLANFENDGDKSVTVSYLVVSHRTSSSGTSAVIQEGKMEVMGRSEAVLTTFRINVMTQDSYYIELSTFLDGRLVGQDSAEYNWK